MKRSKLKYVFAFLLLVVVSVATTTVQAATYNRGKVNISTVIASQLAAIEDGDEPTESVYDYEVYLTNRGYTNTTLQKNPVYRQTPRGIEIADIMLLVRKRDDYKGYLIPCIAWNGVATYSRILKCKDKVKLCGRIQSRKYKKVIDKDLLEEHVAYEVSITKIVKI